MSQLLAALQRGLPAPDHPGWDGVHFIVLDLQVVDDLLGYIQTFKPVHIQALISKLPVETLDEWVVHQLTWRNEAKLDCASVGLQVETLLVNSVRLSEVTTFG